MLSVPGQVKVFLCLTPTDMRKSIDGLAGMATNVLSEDPLSGHLFVFVGKRRDRLKLLYFDGDGYALWYKKLEAEDTRIVGFPEVPGAAYNRRLGSAEVSRMVRIPRKSGPRRCPMSGQGSLPVPPRAR